MKRLRFAGASALVLIAGVCISEAADARAQDATPRKKIALALQGGGALGLIHLGAIEWLEEHRIPIDGIAGNSGGALSGGWYATGLELLTDAELRNPPAHDGPESMRLHGVADVLGKLDFAALFAASPSYWELPLARKLERRRFPSELVYGIAAGEVRAPDGLLPAPKVRLLLDAITARFPVQYLYGANADAPFDALPTPFRCVATDTTDKNLSNWKTVILGGKDMLPKAPGYQMSLSRALRASMAVPVAFTPVYVPPLSKPGGATSYALIDGFVKDNYPIDVADAEFRPEVLIGFYFGENANTYRPKADYIPVQLDTGGLGPDQYVHWRRLTWLGYESMERAYRAGMLERLKPLMLSFDDYLAYRERRRGRAGKIGTIPQRVIGDGALPLDRVRAAAVGKDVTDEGVRLELDRALLGLLSDGNLATVGYELEQQDGVTVLRVRPEVRAFGPPFIHVGTTFDAGGRDRLWVQQSAEAVKPTHFGSLWRFEASAGTDQSASVAFELPTSEERVVLSPSASLDHAYRFNFAEGTRASGVRLLRADGGLSVRFRPVKNADFSLGAFAATLDSREGTGLPLATPSGSYSYLSLRGETDTTDAPFETTSGYRGHFDVRSHFGFPGASGTLNQLEAEASWYRPWGRAGGTVFVRGACGTSFGREAPFAARFNLGGIGALDAYVRDEVLVSGYASFGVGGHSKVSTLPYFFGNSYLCWQLEAAQSGDRLWSSGTLGFLLRTRFSPLFAGVSMGDDGRWRMLFVTGSFRL